MFILFKSLATPITPKWPQKDSPADKVKGLPTKVELPQVADVVASPPSGTFSVPVEAGVVTTAGSSAVPAQQPNPTHGPLGGTMPNQGIRTPAAWAGGGLSPRRACASASRF